MSLAKFMSCFPQLEAKVRGRPLIYFDNGASSLRPKVVSDRIQKFYLEEAANVHRGSHYFSNLGTDNFEKTRVTVSEFIGAQHMEEVVFTSGTTEAVNIVASGLDDYFSEGDEIILSTLEHHSNIVPWQQLAIRKKAVIKWVDLDSKNQFDFEHFKSLLTDKTKLVAMSFYSNALGCRLPVEKIIAEAKNFGALSFVDAAQAVLHEVIDVQKIKCDYLSFSGHKMFGPNGVGVLYGKKASLEKLSPSKYGGSMIQEVTKESATFNVLPFRLEAGTPNVAGVLGLQESIKFIKSWGFDFFEERDKVLSKALFNSLTAIDGLELYQSEGGQSGPVQSFNLEGVHASDVGQVLDNYGVAVRVGHHCTQPLMKYLGISGTVRVSLAAYNTLEEIDQFVECLKKTKEFF